MDAGEYNPKIQQGATFIKNCQWLANGSPVNLSGYTIRGKIKRKASDPKELVSFTCTITNAAQGQFTIALTAQETAAIPIAQQVNGEKEILECIYDVEAVTGSTVYRLFEGKALISPEATR